MTFYYSSIYIEKFYPLNPNKIGFQIEVGSNFATNV